MKCNKCGSELPKGFNFCTKCGNKIDNTPQGNIVPVPVPRVKRPFYKNPIFYVIVIAVIAVSAILTVFSVQLIKGITSKPTEPTEVTEEEITEPTKSELKTYEIPPISISVPEYWTTKSEGETHYFYATNGSMMSLTVSESNMDKYMFGEDLVDDLLESFSSAVEDFKPINENMDKMICVIGGELAYNTRATFKSKSNGTDNYESIYFFATDNHMCVITFINRGTEQSDEFDMYEYDIIDSIVIKETTEEETEPETAAPETESETEPETELETQEPTELSDTLTELYSDDYCNVWFYSFENSKYENDEKIVTLLIENKTDKTITYQCETVNLNDIGYNKVIMSDPIAAHSKGFAELEVRNVVNCDTLTSISANLRSTDFESDSEYRQKIAIERHEIN